METDKGNRAATSADEGRRAESVSSDGRGQETSHARNVWIDICRLMASLVIMFFHFPIEGLPFRFESGALFVEYFFMLTGFFAVLHMEKRECDTGCISPYMRGFYMRALPYVVVGVMFEYASRMLTAWPDTSEMARIMSFLPFDVMLLQSTNIYHSGYHVLWYLSITMICLPVVMYMRRRLSDVWQYLVIVGPLVCYGLVMQTVGTLRVNRDILDAAQRAFGGMLLGGLALVLSRRLGSRNLTKWQRAALLVMEIGFMATALLLMTKPELEKTRHDSVTVFLLFCSLVISLSQRTATAGIRQFRGSSWLAPISLSVYCLHYGVFDLVAWSVSEPFGTTETVSCGIGTVLLSVVLVAIVKRFQKSMGKTDAADAKLAVRCAEVG